MGRNIQSTLTIHDLHPGIEGSIVGTIFSIEPVRTFQRKNGSSGRYVRLGIADETGNAILMLWNEDTKLVESKTIQQGTTVKIINGYTKKGYQGIEIHVGKWSHIEPVSDSSKTKPMFAEGKPQLQEVTICGCIDTIEPTRVFFKDDGSYGFVTVLSLETAEGIKQLTVWDDNVKQLQGFGKGDRICISQVDTRMKDGSIEYHVNGKAFIKKD